MVQPFHLSRFKWSEASTHICFKEILQSFCIKILKMFGVFKNQKCKIIRIEEIIRPLYLVTSLLGLFPCSVKFDKSTNLFKVIHKSIYFNSLCGISIVLTILAFLILHIQEVLLFTENVSMTQAIMTQMNYILELINLIIFCIVAYACAFLNRNKYVKVLNMIITTWLELPTNVNSHCILNHLKFHVKIVTMTCLLTVCVLQVSVNFSRKDSLWKMTLVAITFDLPQTIQFVTLALYYALVMMVVAILSNINDHCLELSKEKRIPLNGTGGILNVKTKSVTLRQIELTYVKTFEIKTTINEAFQGPILASTIQCFHCIVSEAHIIYHGLVIDGGIKTHDVVNCGIWIVYQIMKIYALAYAGNLLKLEAVKIGQSLHNIPIEKQDVRYLMEIQHFSSLMFYQRIEMTVYEYFPLDATLIYNMLASAMMYLIILVQFDRLE